MWDLEETVPDRVRAFWARVVALYQAEPYGAAFEEAFRVLDTRAGLQPSCGQAAARLYSRSSPPSLIFTVT